VTFNTALRLGRVSNLPTVWSNVLAGTALAGAAIGAPVAGVMLAASALYVGGMYLNDAFDREIDAAERPGRPIPSGQVSAETVFAIGYALLFCGVLGLAAVGSATAGSAAAGATWGITLAAFIVAYDMHHKNSATAPAIMGACRALVYFCAAAALVEQRPPAFSAAAAFALLCYVIGLTYTAAFENAGSLRNRAPLILLIVAPAVAATSWDLSLYVLPAIAAFCAWTMYAIHFASGRKEIDIPGAVVRLIAGIALVDAMFAAAAGRPDLALAAAAMLPLTRLLQRFIPGT
jgi:hypothetical protein